MKCSNWKEKNTFIQTPFGKQSPHHAAPKQNSSPVPSGLLCSRGWTVGARGAVAPLHCRSGGDLSHPSCDALSDDSVMASPHSWLEVGVARLMYVSIFIAFLTCF